MKRIGITLSLLLAIEMLYVASPTHPASLNYEPQGNHGTLSVQGDIRTPQVGDLKLDQGVAIVKENTIDIQAVEPGEKSKQTVLSGIMVNAKSQVSGTQGDLSGYVYFHGGKDLAKIYDPRTEESIAVRGEDTAIGKIVSVGAEQITIATKAGTTRQISTDKITHVYSPRIYNFTIAMNDVASVHDVLPAMFATAGSITLDPTTKPKTKHPVRKVAIVLTGEVLLATAITLPIVIPLATRRHRHPIINTNTNTSNASTFNMLSSSPPPTPSIVTPPPPPPPPPPLKGGRRRGGEC